jgi:MSHA biogenesis protein MshK
MKHKAEGGRPKAEGGIFSSFILHPSSLLLPVCALISLPAAMAQVLNDPTRPPAGIYSTDGAAGAVSGGPVLQSVMITPSERSAIIGGERIKLGGKYGEARVIKITENEVILRSANGTETLRMYPDVTMKQVEPAPPVSAKPVKKNRRPATNTQGKQG